MAGSDGNRGYLVQTLIALLNSLQSNNWDQVTIEPKHESEKIDILWESDSFRKAAQVKSTNNQFKKPDVVRWAKEVEAGTVADELELVLVGSCTPSLTRIRRIGNVGVPCPKNLDWDGLFSEASHLLDRFLYSLGLSVVSPDMSRLLAKGLVAELSSLASQSKTLTRSELSSLLTNWVQTISPESTRSFHDSALSKTPRSVRPNLGSKLIGRDEEIQWLRDTDGDKLIVGQPGIGKTFLLREFVRDGSSCFLRSDDNGKIENAIRVRSPIAIVVEDAHLHLEAIDFLRRFRADSGLSFSVIADCWPGSRDEVMEKLGIRKSKCIELKRVSDQEIVDIVHDCGIKPSNSFLHMVVRQSSGFPGRAMMLVETCLGGTHEDYQDFWTGETLSRWVRTRFTELIGREAIQVLACFAIGGRAGVATETVAKTLQLPRARVLQIVADLSLGGVVVEPSSGRIAVVPSSIRPVLVRDHFSGSAAIPLVDYLEDQLSFSETVTTIVEAHSLGADFSTDKLRNLVKRSNSNAAWSALIHSSNENAKFALEEKPSLIRILASDFLQTVPDLVIPELLRLADGDSRPLHSNTDHPLRLLSDWVQSGFPGREALPRRRKVFNALCELVHEIRNTNLSLRLMPIAVSPQYEDREQNPGNRFESTIRSGCVSAEDLQGIAEFWKEILGALKCCKFEDWNPVLEATREWLCPHFGGGARVSDEQRAVFETSASQILLQLVKLAEDRPGVLRKLAEIAEVHKVELSYTIHPTFDSLFPRGPSYEGDYEKQLSKFAALDKKSRALGESWAENAPVEIVTEISRWIAEAAFTGRPWPDLCASCCDAISSKIHNQLPWVRAIMYRNARADLVAPFLHRAIDADEDGGEGILNECVGNETYRCIAIKFALTHPKSPKDIVDRAIAEASKVPDTVRTTVMLHEVDDHVISKLLESDNPKVVCETLEGIWHKLKKSPTDAPWYDKWRETTVLHLRDKFCLRGALNDDPQLCHDWIAYLASAKSDNRHLKSSDISPAVARMTHPQRSYLVDSVKANAQHASTLLIALVGDSPEIYKSLLKKKQLKEFWSFPLRRMPDTIWNEFAGMALDSGISDENIVVQTRIVLSNYCEVPDKCHHEIEAWTSCLELVDYRIRRIVEAGLKEARSELEYWKRDELDVDL